MTQLTGLKIDGKLEISEKCIQSVKKEYRKVKTNETEKYDWKRKPKSFFISPQRLQRKYDEKIGKSSLGEEKVDYNYKMY